MELESTTIDERTSYCRLCQQDLPLSAFRMRPDRPDLALTICKVCLAKRPVQKHSFWDTIPLLQPTREEQIAHLKARLKAGGIRESTELQSAE